MPSDLEFDPMTLALDCLHRGGADVCELEMNRLARAVIALLAETQRLARELEESNELCKQLVSDAPLVR